MSEEESNSRTFLYENEIIWVRAEGDYLATIDSNATLVIRKVIDGNISFTQRLNGTLIDSGYPFCDVFNHMSILADTEIGKSCLMVNGDFTNLNFTFNSIGMNSSSDHGLEKFRKLYLNVCVVEYRYTSDWDWDYDLLNVKTCEFLDFSALDTNHYPERFDVSDELSLTNKLVSEDIFAITYPTESGTMRVFSNNSVSNLDTGEKYLIPIRTSCEETWGYNCDNWPETEEEMQRDPEIWYWFSPITPPYPSEDGESWFVTKCENRPHNTWYTQVHLLQNNSWDIVYSEHQGSGSQYCGNAPVVIDGIHCLGQYTVYCPQYGDIIYTYSTERNEHNTATNHQLKSSWFWSRLWFSCKEFNTPNEYNEWHYARDGALNSDFRCSDFQNYKDSSFNGPFDYNRYLLWDNETIDGTEISTATLELELFYAIGSEVFIAPDIVGLNTRVLDETSHSNIVDKNIFTVLIIILIPALLLTASSNFNNFTARNIEKLSRSHIKGSTIRNIYYGNWHIKKQELAVDVGSGFIAIILAFIYASVVATGYLIVAGFYGLMYLIAAYLIVSGIILLFTVGAVGLICFLPFLILLPLFG
jgi:hypothetical protein